MLTAISKGRPLTRSRGSNQAIPATAAMASPAIAPSRRTLGWTRPNDDWVMTATPTMKAAADNRYKASLGAGDGMGLRFWSWQVQTRAPALVSTHPAALASQAA